MLLVNVNINYALIKTRLKKYVWLFFIAIS
jgi:hypothetical protein